MDSPLLQIVTLGWDHYVYETITRHLGNFIHLSRDKLNVSAWAGECVLEDVSIRPDALRGLSLPLRVRKGNAARICVRIPWHSLRSEPLSIKIEVSPFCISPSILHMNPNPRVVC